ncbi:MAG: hypothetical protein A3F70_11665 [Acidobacteria bacterium RIFCSPLOWO2_12_FULL_67_14]|nr:MAG: hypothetical protein A3F70_11665 [Acidobacteria bacterium RIFCSPLOWO2_12_FULL_67_14]
MSDVVELRTHVARSIQGRAASIVQDAAAVYPFAGLEQVATDDRARLADLAFQLLTAAVRDDGLEAGHALISDLARLGAEKHLGVRQLFSAVYLMERSALDELALDESFGVSSEPWAAVTQIIRRASFDVCGAFSEQAGGTAVDDGIVDPLTTLYTRQVFVAALNREIQRSERFGHPFAIILLDVDRLAEINARHGYGAGDRVLERVGIVVRNYFRETDWVARVGEDTYAVLMPETEGVHAERLADRMRVMVQERLQLHDHRSEEQFPVTVSVAVLIAKSVDRRMQATQLLTDAEEALDRAKHAGRNRVERVVVQS